ncbi:MAG: PAS domain S-box protein [Clostridia bacterium]|nr:PAS domain S-box protein [Clostridia bacterium]
MDLTLTLLIASTLVIIILITYIFKKKHSNQMTKIFKYNLIFMLIWDLAITLQYAFSDKLPIHPIYYDYIAYIGICFLPVFVLLTGLSFSKTKIKFTYKYLLLFIVPITSLILLWTNNNHHLFYEYYSTNFRETVFGPYFLLHSIYSYSCIGIGILILLIYSIKNVGLFSKQSLLFVVGSSFCLIVNMLSTFGILDLSIYTTPISFTITILLFFFAIFKFNFLGVTPIALQKIVDRISDSYIVIDDNYNIVDFNKTFLTTFKINTASDIRGKNINTFLKESKINIKLTKIINAIKEIKSTDKTISFELCVKEINKYFNVEINSILANGQSLGTLMLFKDITQHKQDIQTIKDTQDSLMESERLSSLGQLIGGIAHNLKTPIMSIAGAAEGLTDLVKEYDESIDDPTVNSGDHHEIAKDMSKWIIKIKEYSEYMSDVITAVKGQAVAMSNEDDITFTVSELIKRVNILMKHELKNAIITLNIQCLVDENLTVHGDVNNLVQVINNMISNAIQAYNGKREESIEFIISQNNNNVIFSIEDNAGGLPKKVQDKLFKEMITTKGKNGTGLGLYMSYSTIKAHFNGSITYETEAGKGTRFDITIPIKQ